MNYHYKTIEPLNVWRVAALCSLLLMMAAAPIRAAETEAAARLTEAQAVQVASEFCQRVGAPVTADGVADYPLPQSLASAEHWQLLWRVRFKGQATVEVVDATGNVAAYTNDALNAQRDKDWQRPAQPGGINIREAEQKAMALVEASGNKNELGFKRAVLWQITQPPTAAGQGWMVSFERMKSTVPYRDQGAHVVLDPESGLATTFITRFRTPPPAEESTMRFTPKEELETAEKQLIAAGKPGTVRITGKKLVVQPNTFWENGGKGKVESLPISRVAAVYYYRTTEGNYEWTYEVWVDLDTGKVIGGAKSGAPIDIFKEVDVEAVRTAFQTADEMRFYRTNDTALAPVVVLGKESHPEMWKELKDKTYFLTSRSRLNLIRPSEGKIVFSSAGQEYTMNYDLENGLVVVAADRWGIMSNEFRAWLTKESSR